MTAIWIPRPPHPNEPACWSWPVPSLVDRDAELARLITEAERVAATEPDPDARRDPAAFRYLLVDMNRYRFDQFHADRCALCEAPFGRLYTRCVDHCHVTGQMRGLLCKGCNSSEGNGDSPIARLYRAWHPAAILDHHAMYSGTGWTNGWAWSQHGERFDIRPPTPWPAWDDAWLHPDFTEPWTDPDLADVG